MPEGQRDQPPERDAEAARKIRELLFDLHCMADAAGYGMVAHFLHMAIIEANHLAGDDNVIELRKK